MMQKSTQKLFSLLLCIAAPTLASAVPTDPRDANPVEVGSALPQAQLTSPDGNLLSLHEVAGSQKSILIFYRGAWCPYCTKHLAAVGQYEQAILDKGYQIIAISPDQPEQAANYADEAEFNYSIYSDPDRSTIKAFGLAFETINRRTQTAEIRPVPAIYITDSEGRITFRHFDANYKERLSPEELMNALN